MYLIVDPIVTNRFYAELLIVGPWSTFRWTMVKISLDPGQYIVGPRSND